MPIKWADAPSGDDLADAAHYVTLLGADVAPTPDSPVVFYPAKDLLRASRCVVLPYDNAGVRKYLDRYRHGTEVAPVLLVPGDLIGDVPLTIAEGFHRVCAAYHLGEDTPVGAVWLTVDG